MSQPEQIDVTGMKRKEKFRYLKAKGFKVRANMTNKELDALCGMDEPPAEQKSVRGERSKNRIPLGRHRPKLSVSSSNIPAGKVPRWVNDKDGRIKDALDGGYEFVNDPNAKVGEDTLNARLPGNAISRQVGTREDGSPLTAYLMVIDKELYDEDQKEKLASVNAIDEAIKAGRHESRFEDGKYIPKEGIKYNP
jgi:hypothetical protein